MWMAAPASVIDVGAESWVIDTDSLITQVLLRDHYCDALIGIS